MLYKTDIAILALGRMGSTHTVINLDIDQAAHVKVLNRFFPSTLKKILRKYPWSFATKFGALQLLGEDPLEGTWAYDYKAPSDCLVVRQIAPPGAFLNRELYEDEKHYWKEVHDASGALRIYSNVKDAQIEYTKNVETSAAFPDHVAEALSWQLALDTAPGIVTANYAKIQQTLLNDARRGIADAWADDLNSRPQEQPATSDNPLVRARL